VRLLNALTPRPALEALIVSDKDRLGTESKYLLTGALGRCPRQGVTALLAKRAPRFALRPSADMPPFDPCGLSGPFVP
jgi:hypothetical protein